MSTALIKAEYHKQTHNMILMDSFSFVKKLPKMDTLYIPVLLPQKQYFHTLVTLNSICAFLGVARSSLVKRGNNCLNITV